MSSPISGFTAVPNPQMLAFMPIQSYLMMYFAGSGWQYGKRKISAMSNEQFNKLTPEELLKQHSIELKNMLPTLSKSLNDVTPLVRILVEQYGDFIKAIIEAAPEAFEKAFGGTGDNLLLGFEKLFHRLTTSAFPSLPEAGAVHREEFIPKTSTTFTPSKNVRSSATPIFYKGRFMSEFEWAQIKEQERSRQLSIARQVKTVTPIPQVRQGLTKKAAGQSQKMERLRLIRIIADLGQKLKLAMRKGGNSGVIRAHSTGLAQHQQKLVNLLARYRF